MEPSDYYDAPIKSRTVYSKCRIHKWLNKKWKAQQIIEVRRARTGKGPPLMHSFIHSFKAKFKSNGIICDFGTLDSEAV
jgi:hypothetical protein